MGDCIKTKQIVVTVQENGIIRNSKGRLIARLTDDIEFEEEHIVEEKMYSKEELENHFIQCNHDIRLMRAGDIRDWIKENLK